MLKKISIKGVLLGALADSVGSSMLGLFLGVYLVSRYQPYLLPTAEQSKRLVELLVQDPVVLFLSGVVGGGFTVLGGYIAARIAKKHELLNGTLSSFICILSGILSINTSPLHLVIIGVLISPPLGYLGGYLRLKQVKKK